MQSNTDLESQHTELVEAIRKYPPATLHEVLGQQGAMTSGIKPLWQGASLCGPSLTVGLQPGDNLMLHYALTIAKPGDVLVVDGGGCLESGPWGEVLTVAAMQAGIAGLVIDGSVRDAAAIRNHAFPLFCRALSIKGTTKQCAGTVNQPVLCGGIMVQPGDIVVGDDDGIVVVPRKRAMEAAESARNREQKEEAMMASLRRGHTTVELLDLEKPLADLDLPNAEL